MPRAASTLDAFQVGATYRLTGVAGQRATRSGALDGYRLWLRDAADLVRLAGADPAERHARLESLAEAVRLAPPTPRPTASRPTTIDRQGAAA